MQHRQLLAVATLRRTVALPQGLVLVLLRRRPSDLMPLVAVRLLLLLLLPLTAHRLLTHPICRRWVKAFRSPNYPTRLYALVNACAPSIRTKPMATTNCRWKKATSF